MIKTLFEPVRVGQRESKNRLAKTATAETRGTPDGFVTDEYVDWYTSFARGGVGIIHTGIVYPTRASKASPHEVGLDHDDKIPGFRKLAGAVHAHGCLVLAQLHHPGRQMIPIPGLSEPGAAGAVAPSAVRNFATGVRPRALTTEEVQQIPEDWAAAARRAEEAGLDGVQLHVAHGYLLHSFVSPRTNRRVDDWGGSLDRRVRIVRDVVSAIRKRTGPKFLVTAKMSGNDGILGGLTPRSAADVAETISRMEIDAIEVSSGTYEYPCTVRGDPFVGRMVTDGLARYLPLHLRVLARVTTPLQRPLFSYHEGFNMDAVRRMRSRVSKPILCLGGFSNPDVMAALIERGEGDIVSLGRQLIADPDFPSKVARGEAVRPCTFCNTCIALVGVRPARCYRDKDPSMFLPPDSGAVRSV